MFLAEPIGLVGLNAEYRSGFVGSAISACGIVLPSGRHWVEEKQDLWLNHGSLFFCSGFYSSLVQWFETAPSRTCPQCRIQVRVLGGSPQQGICSLPQSTNVGRFLKLNSTSDPFCLPCLRQFKPHVYSELLGMCACTQR